MKTIMPYPDDTDGDDSDDDQEIVDTHAIAEVIIAEFCHKGGAAVSSDDKVYRTYNRFDNQGRLAETISPSAITGIGSDWETILSDAEGNSDLLYGDGIAPSPDSPYVSNDSGLVESDWFYGGTVTSAGSSTPGIV